MTSEQDKAIWKVIKSYRDGKITAGECRKKLQQIFNEATLEEFWRS